VSVNLGKAIKRPPSPEQHAAANFPLNQNSLTVVMFMKAHSCLLQRKLA
jgi:hypothetical protein